MAGYDSPWMAMGLREDGYPVLNPREYRQVPMSESDTAYRDELMRAMGAKTGGQMTKKEKEWASETWMNMQKRMQEQKDRGIK